MINVLELIEWVEQEPNRARRLILFSVIFTYIFITLSILVGTFFNINLEKYSSFYYSFSTVAAGVIAFYTGFVPKTTLNKNECKDIIQDKNKTKDGVKNASDKYLTNKKP